jgi:hypothetical protein
VALVRTDVSEEPGASFIRVTKEPHGVTTQKTQFFKRVLWNASTERLPFQDRFVFEIKSIDFTTFSKS